MLTQGTWAVTGYLAQYSLPLPPTQQVAQYVYNIIADNGYHDGNFTSPTITVTVLSIPAVITVLSSPSLVINYSTQVSLTWSIGSPTISAAVFLCTGYSQMDRSFKMLLILSNGMQINHL